MDRLAPATTAYWKDRRANPFPPALEDFAAGSGVAAFADRWLAQNDGWIGHGRTRDLKPAAFPEVRSQPARFEEDLAAAEEALLDLLTRPPDGADDVQPAAPDTS